MTARASGGTLVFVEQAYTGWSVEVDGGVKMGSSDHEGLLAVEVPPDARAVTWSYGDTTPERRAGWLLSALGLLFAGIWFVGEPR